MHDARQPDDASRSTSDPVTGHPEDLPDAFGEDPDHKKPLVENAGIHEGEDATP